MKSTAILTAATAALVLSALGCSMSGTTLAQDEHKPMPAHTKDAMAEADPQMRDVLNALVALKPQPIEMCSPSEARKQPLATDAVMKVMKDKGIDAAPEPMADVDNTSVTGADGKKVKVRVYKPIAPDDKPLPVIVYARGGGWVIATLDTYDASCRALAKMTGALVVSVDYRVAPEYKYPAAHDDVYNVLEWALMHADEMKGDKNRVAIAGESAGGNMAAAACLRAKKMGAPLPVAQLLIYPVADASLTSPATVEYADAKPLNRPMLPWFLNNYLAQPTDGMNHFISLVKATREELTGLPPATVINAEIDPLRDDGVTYARHLKDAGVNVESKVYPGVSHEFFGMGKIVDKALDAEKFASERLRMAFNK